MDSLDSLDSLDQLTLHQISSQFTIRDWINFHQVCKSIWNIRSLQQFYDHKTNFYYHKFSNSYQRVINYILEKDDLDWLLYFLDQYRGKFSPSEFAMIISNIPTRKNYVTRNIYPEFLINYDSNLKERIQSQYQHIKFINPKSQKDFIKTEVLKLQRQLGHKFILFHLRELCNLVKLSIFSPSRYSYTETELIQQLLKFSNNAEKLL